MKLRLNELTAHCQQPLKPIYWLSGDEPLQIKEAIATLCQAASQQGFGQPEKFYLETGFRWEHFSLQLSSRSLLAERRVLCLQLPTASLPTAGQHVLKTYIEHANPDTVLIISSPKLAASTTNTKWFKQLTEQGVHLAIWPLNAGQFRSWLNQRCRQAGFQADSQALQLLAEHVAGNLLAADNAIEKLRLTESPGPLSQERLIAVLIDESRYTIFECVDAALAGNASLAIKMLTQLQADTSAASLLLWAFARDLRILVTLSQQISQGTTPAAALQSAKLMPQRKPLLSQALTRHQAAHWNHTHQRLSQIDQQIKGTLPGNPWQSFQALIQSIACKQALAFEPTLPAWI